MRIIITYLTITVLSTFMCTSCSESEQVSTSVEDTKITETITGEHEFLILLARDMLPEIINSINQKMINDIDFQDESIKAYIPLTKEDVTIEAMTREFLIEEQFNKVEYLLEECSGLRMDNMVYISPSHREDYAELYDTVCHEVLHMAVCRTEGLYSYTPSDGTPEDDVRVEKDKLRVRVMLSINEALVHTFAAEITAEAFDLEEPVYFWGSVKPLGPLWVNGEAYELDIDTVVDSVHSSLTTAYAIATSKEEADIFIRELQQSLFMEVSPAGDIRQPSP
jgi:hypothetical protein